MLFRSYSRNIHQIEFLCRLCHLFLRNFILCKNRSGMTENFSVVVLKYNRLKLADCIHDTTSIYITLKIRFTVSCVFSVILFGFVLHIKKLSYRHWYYCISISERNTSGIHVILMIGSCFHNVKTTESTNTYQVSKVIKI